MARSPSRNGNHRGGSGHLIGRRWFCYFLLIEELRIRPTHGFIVLGDGTRERIDNTPELRAWVIELAGQIRAARANLSTPIRVDPKPGQCSPCGAREHCGQARV